MCFRIQSQNVALAVIAFLIGANQTFAEDWPQWRGPNRDAKSNETGLLQSWQPGGPPLTWEMSELGEGYASVVVANGRLHTIGNEAGTIYVYGLSEATGKLIWKTKIGESSRHAMSTPTIDGDYVYALDPDGLLACLHSVTGEIQWQIDFIEEFAGKLQSGRGYGESPLIDGKHLICTPGGDEALVVALNKATGELVWKSAAPSLGTKGKDGAAFSSIVKTRVGEIDMYVQLVGRGLVGVECSSGKFLWGYNDISADIVNIPTPIVRGNLVFSANGYNSGSVLLQLHPSGIDQIRVEEVYRLAGNQFQNHHGGVVALEGKIFGGHGSNNGLPSCVDLLTGDVLWKRRGPGIGSAAVVYADNRFVFRYQNGVVALLAADDNGFSIKGKLQIPGAGGDSWSHPVIANGVLFLREQGSLYAHKVQDRGEATAEQAMDAQSLFSESIRKQLKVLEVACSTVGQVNQLTSSIDANHLYRYLFEQPDPNKVERTPVVNLQATNQGIFSDNVISVLDSVEHDFVIDLAGTEINVMLLKQLQGLSHLKGLDLQFCSGVSAELLAQVGELKQLRLLRLAGTDISDVTIEQLVRLKELRCLDLEVCENISDDALAVIATMEDLKCLILKKTAFEKLKITDAGVASLSSLKKLEVLSLYGNRVTDAGMQSVAQLGSLRVLDLSLVGIKDTGVASLAELPNLEELYLLYNTGFAGPILTDEAMETIKGFDKLRQLSLVGSRITNASVEAISGLKNLTDLQLQYSRVDMDGFDAIQAALPNLKITR